MISGEVVICGAGVIGCAIARELAGAGASVIVLDRGKPGGEASGAAAGLLTPWSTAEGSRPLADLCAESFRRFDRLAGELFEETGIDVGLRRCGMLLASPGPAQRDRFFAWQSEAGFSLELVSGTRLSKITAGNLTPKIESGLYFGGEAVVDNRLLTRALWLSAQARGARFMLDTPALRVRLDPTGCTGVETSSGIVSARITIDAAGAWAPLDGTLPFSLPVSPARGQIVELQTELSLPPALHRGEFYMTARGDGRLLLGSTVEHGVTEKCVTAEVVKSFLNDAIEIMPGLASAKLSNFWAGLRPATPDGLPVLGESPVPGLLLACGHFRNGILLAPVTAEILADLVGGRKPAVDLRPFRVDRFSGPASVSAGEFSFTERNSG